MVHALQRAGRRLRPGGILVSIKPHRKQRPLIAITRSGERRFVVPLINPAFERYLAAADAALDRVVREGWFTRSGATGHRYRVRLKSPAQLRRYIDMLGTPKPRFPPGGRAELLAQWKSVAPGARIEVTESMAVTALRNSG